MFVRSSSGLHLSIRHWPGLARAWPTGHLYARDAGTVVPVLGAFVVWIPAALFLLLDSIGGKALILALWGLIVVGGIDNDLYPMLVGRRRKMHTLLAFVSIVGGLIVFGSSGLILGPVIFATTRFLLEVWNQRNAPR